MRHPETPYLQHILDAILKLETYLRGMSEADFMADTRTQDAVLRQL